MKIKLLMPIVKDGKEIEAGHVIDVPEHNAPKWVSRGWGEPVAKKIQKIKKETKELKVDSKEIK